MKSDLQIHYEYAKSLEELDRLRSSRKNYSTSNLDSKTNSFFTSLSSTGIHSTNDINVSHKDNHFEKVSNFKDHSKSDIKTQTYSYVPSPIINSFSSPNINSDVPNVLSNQSRNQSTKQASSLLTKNYQEEISKSTSAIISSFHELQRKANMIEQERDEFISERDEVQRKIYQLKMQQQSSLTKSSYDSAKKILDSKDTNESLRNLQFTYASKAMIFEDVQKTLVQTVASKQMYLATLINDMKLQRNNEEELSKRNKVLKDELSIITSRVDKLESFLHGKSFNEMSNLDSVGVYMSPSKEKLFSIQSDLESQVSDAEAELRYNQHSIHRLDLKYNSMLKYMQLIVNMNYDLIQTLQIREENKHQIYKLAGRKLPPHYAWPKDLSHQNFQEIADMVNNAATLHAISVSPNQNIVTNNIRRSLSTTRPKRVSFNDDHRSRDYSYRKKAEQPKKILLKEQKKYPIARSVSPSIAQFIPNSGLNTREFNNLALRSMNHRKSI